MANRIRSQQATANISAAVTTSSSEVLKARSGGLIRTQMIIVNTSAADYVTVAKGDVAAVVNQGIRIAPGGSYVEATDGGYTCWQGAVQVIGSAAVTLAIAESYESEDQ